jgi:hypothetical protein
MCGPARDFSPFSQAANDSFLVFHPALYFRLVSKDPTYIDRAGLVPNEKLAITYIKVPLM